MEQLQSLIGKYWDGTATSEEKQQLLKLLSTDEAGLKEWLAQRYEKDLEENTTSLSPERSLELLQQIRQRKAPVKNVSSFGWMRYAATILLIAGAGWLAVTLFRNTGTQQVQQASAIKAGIQLKQVANTGNVPKTILLPDSSVIALQANSIISYYEPFDNTQRNISLTGKAMFTVVGDPQRPFTVYANGIATIALGTRFMVSTLEQKVDVRLYEGKVMVRSTDKSFIMKDVYLKPGQQINIDIAEKQSEVSGKDEKEHEHTEGLVFRQTPLQQVFNKLSARYNVRIVSNATEMKGLVFTGTFAETDSLQNILSVIAGLNNLSILQEEEKIIIKK
ncbi:FecR domain-containing protein [Chitinophaga niabensis]|uniref:FecR family protein n=1 Tax=Chitinophaga niabensis TaxID=536979 RepID=UPI0031BA165F